MSANRLCVLFSGNLVLCIATAATASAQLSITQDPGDLEDREYRVKIDSTQFGAPHTVGIFGRPKSSALRIRFDGGRTGPDIYMSRLNGGWRVVCVWDRYGNLKFFDSVYIDRSGTLRIPAAFGAARDGGGSGAARRGGLQIDE